MPITGLREQVIEFASAVAEAAAEAFLADADAAAPERSGELKRSRYGPTLSFVRENVIRATCGYSAPQAEWTDQGTRSHPIVARRAKSLRFFWDNGPDGPGWYNFPAVNHPGFEGSGWFTDLVVNWEDYVQSAVEEGGVSWAPPISSLAS